MILRLLLSVLILLVSVTGQADFPKFTPVEMREKGVGDWRAVPFGEMRVLSCTTGVKDLGLAIGGLQVRLNQGWILKKPTLKPLSDEFPAWIEAPVRAGSGRHTVYQKEVFFPIVYARNPADTKGVELGLQGIFPACQGLSCMDLPLRIGVELEADENDYTSFCAYIMDQQKSVPLSPAGHSVRGIAKLEQDVVKLTFWGLEGANIAFLQTPEQDDFEVLETQLEKTGLFMYVKTKPWPMNSSKEWVLITNKGVFRVPVLMQSSPVSLPKESVPFSIWLMGCELFFLTPLFIWLGIGVAKNKKLWQKQIRQFCILLPAVFVLLIARQYLGFNVLLSGKWGLCYIIVLLGLVCLWPPQKWWAALALFLIWPSVIQLPDISFGWLCLWGIVMLVEMGLPFILLYFKADEIGRVLRDYKKKHFFIFNLTFLIPTLALLMMAVYHLNQGKILYQNKLNPNGISIVCEACSSWKEIPNVSFIDPKSIWGSTLKKLYNRSGTIVVLQQKGERFILAPDVSVGKVKRFIKNWNNYHAQYTP